MFKGKKRDSLWLFLTALVVVVMVFALLAIPYAVTESEARKLIFLLRLGVLAIFSGAMLFWWIVRDRQTSQDLKMLREEIEQNKLWREKLRTPRMREENQKERDKQK